MFSKTLHYVVSCITHPVWVGAFPIGSRQKTADEQVAHVPTLAHLTPVLFLPVMQIQAYILKSLTQHKSDTRGMTSQLQDCVITEREALASLDLSYLMFSLIDRYVTACWVLLSNAKISHVAVLVVVPVLPLPVIDNWPQLIWAPMTEFACRKCSRL